MIGAGDLYELAGLSGEPDRWLILGVELGVRSHGKTPRWEVHVYAADRQDLNFTRFEDLDEVAARHGGIPVVDILLHDVTADDVIRCMKLVRIQLRNGHLQHELIHTAYADHPDQGPA